MRSALELLGGPDAQAQARPERRLSQRPCWLARRTRHTSRARALIGQVENRSVYPPRMKKDQQTASIVCAGDDTMDAAVNLTAPVASNGIVTSEPLRWNPQMSLLARPRGKVSKRLSHAKAMARQRRLTEFFPKLVTLAHPSLPCLAPASLPCLEPHGASRADANSAGSLRVHEYQMAAQHWIDATRRYVHDYMRGRHVATSVSRTHLTGSSSEEI